MKNEQVKKAKVWLWYVSIFAFMLIWFTSIHPLTIYDSDDWTYVSFVRKAVPTIEEWNPARIFPEVFMPLCGSIAAYIVAPLISDYVLSFTYVSATVVSFFITLYVYCLSVFIKRLFPLDNFRCRCIEFLFLILHFMVFVHDRQNNEYLFYCHDLSCYYYYLIPALINASVVMVMAGNSGLNGFTFKESLVKQSLFVLVIYFAIFSNLAVSFILAFYSGISVFIAGGKLIKEKKCNKGEIVSCLKNNVFHLYTLILWGISAIYEVSGSRAAASARLGNKFTFAEGVKQAAVILYGCRRNCHRVFFGIALLIIIAAGILFIASRRKSEEDKVFMKMQVTWALAAVLALVYTILLCAKVNPENIVRSEYLFGMFFYGLVILMTAFAYILYKNSQVVIIIPLALCIAASYINTSYPTFKESNKSNINPQVCLNISRDLVEQVVYADQEGEDEVILHVLRYNTTDNWPHALYLGERMSTTLYEHGIVSKHMHITIQPDEMMNEKYHVLIP